ncbi:MAG: hypothetical protein ACI9Y1_003481 [Lentisphaeria bacterium]|jgi:hypothetical protein
MGRPIIISCSACVETYLLVGFAVSSDLSPSEIIATHNRSLTQLNQTY